MSRRVEKQKIMRAVDAEMQAPVPVEKEEPTKISREVFQKIVDMYGFHDKYDDENWSGMISYIAVEGLY